MQNIQIPTTQNISIEYELASIGERLLAAIIDYFFVFIYLLINLFILGVIKINAIFIILFIIPASIYHFIFEIFFKGQSAGKMIMNIQVIRVDGTPPHLADYLIRWILRLIDITIMLGGIATLTIIATEKGQRLGDIAAKTTVIRRKKNISLEDTIYQNIHENYTPSFSEVINLKDSDIDIINDVLRNLQKTRNTNAFLLADKTKLAIEKKMGITSTLASQNFLEIIVKDYSFFGKTS